MPHNDAPEWEELDNVNMGRECTGEELDEHDLAENKRGI
jgi:hypothetical protein